MANEIQCKIPYSTQYLCNTVHSETRWLHKHNNWLAVIVKFECFAMIVQQHDFQQAADSTKIIPLFAKSYDFTRVSLNNTFLHCSLQLSDQTETMSYVT